MNEETQNVRVPAETIPDITPETTIIDVISRYGQREAIFKRLEEETGDASAARPFSCQSP